ncbi:hypothetical protein [Clostridium sardiniense]|uniref:hypothetical protein n=1 Tax=Clostridium sardiniense TaxID=29369 RepID=UPI00195C5F29|nr:hypothetical protein [Clostridium sardiniense]MBM7834910.1 hypothetical protein [Clostridium sardiniense]
MRKKYLLAGVIVIAILIGTFIVKFNSKQNNTLKTTAQNQIEKANKSTQTSKNDKLTQLKHSIEPSEIKQYNNSDKSNQSDEQPKVNQSNERTHPMQPNESPQLNKTNEQVSKEQPLSKKKFISLILKEEILNQSVPKYIIPIKAINPNSSINSVKFKEVDNSDSFLCNDNNKLDNGILVGLQGFNPNDIDHYFIIKDYDAIKNGGNGLIDKGTISNNGQVKFFR